MKKWLLEKFFKKEVEQWRLKLLQKEEEIKNLKKQIQYLNFYITERKYHENQSIFN